MPVSLYHPWMKDPVPVSAACHQAVKRYTKTMAPGFVNSLLICSLLLSKDGSQQNISTGHSQNLSALFLHDPVGDVKVMPSQEYQLVASGENLLEKHQGQ